MATGLDTVELLYRSEEISLARSGHSASRQSQRGSQTGCHPTARHPKLRHPGSLLPAREAHHARPSLQRPGRHLPLPTVTTSTIPTHQFKKLLYSTSTGTTVQL